MTVMKVTGASSDKHTTWSAIEWNKVNKHMLRLQMRIAKAGFCRVANNIALLMLELSAVKVARSVLRGLLRE